MKEIRKPEIEEVIIEEEVVAKKGILRRIFTKRNSLIFLILIAIGGSYGSIHYYNKYQSLKVNPNAEAEKETNKLLSSLGSLMELPQGETPTVATISDKEKLNGQAFFSNAQNGDILFAYTTSMKAILYRPSTNKIINVAPISINQSQDVTSAVAPTMTQATTPITNTKKTTSTTSVKK